MVGLRWSVLLGFCGGVVWLVSGVGFDVDGGTVVGFGVFDCLWFLFTLH